MTPLPPSPPPSRSYSLWKFLSFWFPLLCLCVSASCTESFSWVCARACVPSVCVCALCASFVSVPRARFIEQRRKPGNARLYFTNLGSMLNIGATSGPADATHFSSPHSSSLFLSRSPNLSFSSPALDPVTTVTCLSNITISITLWFCSSLLMGWCEETRKIGYHVCLNIVHLIGLEGKKDHEPTKRRTPHTAPATATTTSQITRQRRFWFGSFDSCVCDCDALYLMPSTPLSPLPSSPAPLPPPPPNPDRSPRASID